MADAARPLATAQTARTRLPSSALRARQRAAVIWSAVAALLLGALFLGTFVVAFMASLKEDPLESPFRFWFPQIDPAAWFAAADLGAQGADAPLWGGFAPGGSVAFAVTYAAPPGTDVEPPEVEVPRRVPGSGIAAALVEAYASDHAAVTRTARAEETFTAPERVRLSVRGGEDLPAEGWTVVRYEYRIDYVAAEDAAPEVGRVPLTATAPRGQVLVASTLPVTQFERRGRVAAWSNVAPGALGLIFDNYRRVLNETVDISSGNRLFDDWLLNSFVIAVGRVLLILSCATLAGYALARMRFSGSAAVFAAVIFSMTIPPQVTFISNYLVIRDLGLLNTPWGVIIVFTFSAHVLMMKQFFEGFPREIEEAAIIDGASRLRILWSVVLPNARPALVANAILAFQAAWNDFFWPFVLLTSQDALTVQVGLLALRETGGGGESDWGLVLAGAFLSIVPVVLLFILFQRHIVDNQVSDGVK